MKPIILLIKSKYLPLFYYINCNCMKYLTPLTKSVKYNLIVLLIFLSTSTIAQDFEWAKSISGSGTIDTREVKFGSDGSVYACGRFTGTANFDVGESDFSITSIGSNDGFIVKYDTDGNFEWVRQFEGSSNVGFFSLALDQNDNIYATGHFFGTVDFDPGPGTFNLTSLNGADVFLLKLDNQGDFLWARHYGNSGALSNSEAISVSVDQSGNAIIVGRYNNTINFDIGGLGLLRTSSGGFDVFIAKVASGGGLMWLREFKGTQSGYAWTVSTNNQNEIFVSGFFSGTFDFDPGPGVFNLTSNGGEDMYVTKLSSNGNFLWAKNFGSSDDDQAEGLAVDDFGNVIISGFFGGILAGESITVELPGGSETFESNGQSDGIIISLDGASSDVNWVQTYGGATRDIAKYLATDPIGNVYVSGLFAGAATFSPSTVISADGQDAFLSKYDIDGNFEWVKPYVGPSNEQGFGVAVFENWDIIQTGFFMSTANFDLGNSDFTLTSAGGRDGFIVKHSQDCSQPTVPTLQAEFNSICPSGTTELQILTGQLNDAARWQWYANTCGDETQQVGTGTTITVEPSVTTTYYVRGEGACGDPGSCAEITITVQDFVPPVISNCPENVTVNNSSGQCTAPASWTVPTAEDNCELDSFESTHNPGFIFPVGETLVTYTAQDATGNTSTCSFTVEVIDTENPVFTFCPSDISVTGSPDVCEASVTWDDPVANDNCLALLTINSNFEPGDDFQVGTTEVIYTASDSYGNTATCSFDVTVSDEEPLTLSPCPDPITETLLEDECSLTITWTPPTAEDNCPFSLTSTHEPGDIFTGGITTVTYMAEGLNGVTESCSFDVTLVDNQNPTITAPDNISESANPGECFATIADLGTPVTDDNCGVASVTNNAPAQFPAGLTTTVIWTVTDDAGNTATAEQLVTITDNEDPTITAPDDLNINSDEGICFASNVDLGIPDVDDNCSVASTSNDAPTEFPIGTTVVTWTVTDEAGNTATDTQNVTVVGISEPIFEEPEPITLNNSPGECGYLSADLVEPLIDFSCGDVTITNDAPNIIPVGTSTITWFAEDDFGNSTSISQEITVVDNEDPEFDNVLPIEISVDSTDCEATNIILPEPSFTDNCGVVNVSNDAPSSHPIGSFDVTWTIQDEAGNSASIVQVVNIVDNIPPTITVSTLIVGTDEGECFATIPELPIPDIDDNCELISFTNDAPTQFPATQTNVVTWTAVDANGNEGTGEQYIAAVDYEPPVPSESSLPTITETCSVDFLTTPTAMDNCDGLIEGYTNTSFPITQSRNVVWIFTDEMGNSTTQIQQVIIVGFDTSVEFDETTISVVNQEPSYSYTWVDCGNDFSPIPGADGASFTPIVKGSYAVIISNGECERRSECIDFEIVSTKEVEDIRFTIYPNPGKGILIIESSYVNVPFVIMDINGRIIKNGVIESKETNIDLTSFEKGVYLIAIDGLVKRYVKN